MRFILPCHLNHPLALFEAPAGGLLHIDIFARLTRPDGQQRVPVVRSGGRDGVDRLVFQQLTQVSIEFGACACALLDDCACLLQHALVHIAQGDEAHALNLGEVADVRLALPV
jgi:hypothetical protein